MQYLKTIPAPPSVMRSYPGAQQVEIRGAARSGWYNVFVLPASAGPTVPVGRNDIPVARSIASVPAHRIHESYGVWPNNPDSTD